MKVNYAYLHQQFQFDDYADELRELVASGEFTLGPYVDRFEKKFADYIGIEHVIAVNTGTDALILCLKALGVGSGDEVITVPNTFYATVGAIVAVGARPVFVDIDDRMQMDPDLIESAISSKTKAIIPVHWGGCPPEMDRIVAVADEHGIPVVEDACPSVGAQIDRKFAGTWGKINAFSMHPLKPLNVMGDGGMVVTDDDQMAAWLRKYRNHGMIDRDHIEFWGINARLQPFQAVVGMRLIDQMEENIAARNRCAKQLDEGLSKLGDRLRTVRRVDGVREAFQLYQVFVTRRPELIEYLNEKEIEVKVHYPVPLHLQEAARELGYERGDFPETERQADMIMTIPAHQYITSEQIEYTVEHINRFYLE
jgi:dTDP-3-amino-2,3,6-trideoxy-4-keto-D-glucose/dTDP-3-amino-3,4,6-trideoxy-alpha-D-glucose/dTDP-2,6-dideoxy-D-kanosamine transaminase